MYLQPHEPKSKDFALRGCPTQRPTETGGYQGLRPWGFIGRGVKPIIHLHLVQRLRIRGSVPPFLHVPSWRGS